MEPIVTMIVIDGFHHGHCVRFPYRTTLKLIKPKVIRVDDCCAGNYKHIEQPEIIEYKECFRAVDREVVFYSVSGRSMDVIRTFGGQQYAEKPWNENTVLKLNYHGEPID